MDEKSVIHPTRRCSAPLRASPVGAASAAKDPPQARGCERPGDPSRMNSLLRNVPPNHDPCRGDFSRQAGRRAASAGAPGEIAWWMRRASSTLRSGGHRASGWAPPVGAASAAKDPPQARGCERPGDPSRMNSLPRNMPPQPRPLLGRLQSPSRPQGCQRRCSRRHRLMDEKSAIHPTQRSAPSAARPKGLPGRMFADESAPTECAASWFVGRVKPACGGVARGIGLHPTYGSQLPASSFQLLLR
ncbi:hypothetical protein HNP29_004015 [Pseudomonas alcaligenes]|nr:hypothetical protein [Pseudomonas alcaligenes]